MAGKEGSRPQKKPGKLRYFYLNGNLHKSLHINRGADTIITWCYPLKKRMVYTYSDTKKFREPAFTTQQVAKMVGRHRVTIENAILDGNVSAPQHVYSLDENMRKSKYMWNEASIMELHEHLLTVHYGRPRKDGIITPYKLPNARELRAMIRQETILYIKDEDGEFKPVWQAKNFD